MASDDVADEMAEFKSVFARSVAVDSQRMSVDVEPYDGTTDREVIRLRQECQNLVDENRRLNVVRSGRIVGCDVQIPVENFVLQSQVDTLRWQLEQTESNVAMYRAVMEQTVLFLDRAHRSLDLLAARLTSTRRPSCSVPRSFSVHHVSNATRRASKLEVPRSRSVAHVPGTDGEGTSSRTAVSRSRSVHQVGTADEFDFDRKKSGLLDPDEIPPEKLSHEAYRLLRTARSLLDATSTKRVVDASKSPDVDDDAFLRQLAREFPSKPAKPAAKLPQPKRVENEYCFMAPGVRSRRNSFAYCPTSTPNVATARRPGSETAFLDRRNSVAKLRSKFFDEMHGPAKERPFPVEKVAVAGSVSSAEDESGFSSMSSFQEVGVPIYEEDPIDPELASSYRPVPVHVEHRRWSSTPVNATKKDPLTVLWV